MNLFPKTHGGGLTENTTNLKLEIILRFIFTKKKIIFHKILDIIGPENKYSHWDYPGSQSKNILILSQPLHELDWNEWELLNGPQSHMSTYTTVNLKKQRSLVYNYLVDHLI
jgi:hypothetical protein